LSWRHWTDRLKHSQRALQFADTLGRGKGRLRWLDHLYSPRRPSKPDLSDWENRELAVAWLGHATVLLRIGGVTVLTDPVLSNRVGLGLGLMTLGPHRMIAPALDLQELPPIDLILISHAHLDHLDRPTLCRLPKQTFVITAPQTQDLIRDLGFRRIVELGWGQSRQVDGVTITARSAKHWGARTFWDKHRGYNAYLLESARHRVLYGGDSAYHEDFKELSKIDLAIMGIGGYDPYVASHATPEQAWAMANHMRAKHILPMHHSTFRLSHEPVGEPMERMLTVAGGDTERVIVRQVGGQWHAN
jgi:L-ascorbate metabolism protein UlaG (beta-lactamase superfamily)